MIRHSHVLRLPLIAICIAAVACTQGGVATTAPVLGGSGPDTDTTSFVYTQITAAPTSRPTNSNHIAFWDVLNPSQPFALDRDGPLLPSMAIILLR